MRGGPPYGGRNMGGGQGETLVHFSINGSSLKACVSFITYREYGKYNNYVKLF